MKLFWKIFYTFVLCIIISFSVYSGLLVSQNFETSLNREIQLTKTEFSMYQMGFETIADMLPDSVGQQQRISEVASSVAQTMANRGNEYALYNNKLEAMFSTKSMSLSRKLSSVLVADVYLSYEIVKEDGKYKVNYVGKESIKGGLYFLEVTRDITHLYNERDQLFMNCQISLLIVVFLSIIVAIFLSKYLTRGIIKLSKASRAFANGELDSRIQVKSNDEVGQLANDFNTMAEKLDETICELKDSARRQADFTASFSHELKTPLTSIIGYSDMLRSMDMSEEERMEATNYIYSQGKRLELLSYKMLELLGINEKILNLKPISVRFLIEKVSATVIPDLERKNISFETYVDECKVLGDADLLATLLINVIDNSRKALRDRKEGKVIIRGLVCKEGYELTIWDNGCGIPASEINRIREAFYMVDKSRSRKEGGAGLGLALCQRIVDACEGKMSIDSELGECTKITFVLKEAGEDDE